MAGLRPHRALLDRGPRPLPVLKAPLSCTPILSGISLPSPSSFPLPSFHDGQMGKRFHSWEGAAKPSSSGFPNLHAIDV